MGGRGFWTLLHSYWIMSVNIPPLLLLLLLLFTTVVVPSVPQDKKKQKTTTTTEKKKTTPEDKYGRLSARLRVRPPSGKMPVKEKKRKRRGFSAGASS